MAEAIVFHKQLGDAVLLQPVIARIAASTAQPVHLSLRPGLEPLIELMTPEACPAAARRFDRVRAFEAGSSVFWTILRMRASRKTLHLTTPKQARWYHRLAYDAVECAQGSRIYRARAYWLASQVGAASDYHPPHLTLPPPGWSPAQPLPPRYLVAHVGSSLRRKEWPATHWVNLLQRLRQNGFPPIVLTAGPAAQERQLAAAVAAAVPGTLDGGGRLDLRQFMHVLSRAAGVIAIDGAASHLAAAFGVPCLTLFGPTRAVDWHEEQPHARAVCAPLRPERPKPVMEDLDPDAVFEILQGWMTP